MKTLMREAIGTSLNLTEREDGSIYTLEFVRNVYKNKALRKMELYDKLEIVQEIQINNTWFVLGLRIHLVEGKPFMIEKHLFNSNIEDVKVLTGKVEDGFEVIGEAEDGQAERTNSLVACHLLLEGEDALLVEDLLCGQAVRNVDGHDRTPR